ASAGVTDVIVMPWLIDGHEYYAPLEVKRESLARFGEKYITPLLCVTTAPTPTTATPQEPRMTDHAPLKLGYKASAEQFGPRDLVEFAVLAERAGMDSATGWDHFQPWRRDGGYAPFSLYGLTAVGERYGQL